MRAFQAVSNADDLLTATCAAVQANAGAALHAHAPIIATIAAVMVLRRRHAGRPELLHLPGGDAIPLAALALALALLASARLANLVAGTIAFAIGAAIYVLSRRSQR